MVDQKVKPPRAAEDVAVDVSEFRRNGDSRVAVKHDPDETECSSSFVDTNSGADNLSGQSDAEVESQFHDDGSLSGFDGFSSLFHTRKKKLTTHWRNFIQPLMWRCKWTELKMRELQSQAAKYTREIELYDQRKRAALDETLTEECGSRSLPYSFHNHRQKLMKRRNRNKIEETTDTSSYISNHCLFSFHESRKNDLDGASFVDDSNPVSRNASGVDDSGNNFLEDNGNILEQTLLNIELAHTRVHKMKARLDLVMNKYACKFSSSESLNHFPGDAQMSSIPSPTFSACNGDNVSARGFPSPPYMQECDIRDFIMTDSMASSYGEALLIPDIIESTAGFLSLTDVTQHHGSVGDSREKIVDNINLHNGSAEGQTSRKRIKTETQSPQKRQDPDNSEEDESIGPLHPLGLESDTTTKTAITMPPSTSRSGLTYEVHIPKNKRKRGERKAGSVGWSRQNLEDFDI